MKTTELIKINEEHKEFHLRNEKISYIFRVIPELGQLENLYYGPQIPHETSFSYLIEREVRPANNLITDDYTSSLEHIRQEYPTFGTTDFRAGAYEIQYPDGDYIPDFRFDHAQINIGYPNLGELPHARYDDQHAKTLAITLKDTYSDLKLILNYTINSNDALIVRSNQFINPGTTTYHLKKALSVNLDLPDDHYDLTHLHGAWAKEMQLEKRPLLTGTMSIDSRRGASSHQHHPFLALSEKNTTEDQGLVYATTLLYSGNFVGSVEVDNYQVTRLSMGISPTQFDWVLGPHQAFQTPEAILTCTTHGFNEMSQNFHHFFTTHLINKSWANQPKPILINNWEATYFDFTENQLIQLIDHAHDLGIDLFVLDDGWFGQRNSDHGSLGNWQIDFKKLPAGLTRLTEHVHELGMKFGLWFEPEMISTDTPLYSQHPEWLIGHPHKRLSHGRNQYVLDFSNPAVVDAVFAQMKLILEQYQIDYVKWDMNRYISEAFSNHLDNQHQGEIYHRYILGVYHLYHMLETNYPHLLIESCAGGGGRFDAGMLYYAPQAWASDDTDAIERLKIQYGASYLYPLQSISSHVSAVPNHQVGRITPLATRANVALFGTFGYELDPTKLTESEREQIKHQIGFVKKYQHLIRTGLFYRLSNPFVSNTPAWMVVNSSQDEALVGDYQILSQPNPGYRRLKLTGLDPARHYHLWEVDRLTQQLIDGRDVSGASLMNIGILLNKDYTNRANDYWQRPQPLDFDSRLFYIASYD